MLLNQLETSQTNFSQSAAELRAALVPGLQVSHRKAGLHIHVRPPVVTALSGPAAPERGELESFVRQVFKRAHGADIKHFMPQLMSLRSEQGELLAVCGLRHAEECTLFLETYLDQPVEAVLSRSAGQNISRQAIVEVGNLAVGQRSHIRSLLASVSLYLHGTAKDWAVFTGNPTLRNSMTRLSFPLHLLAQAKLSALPEHERADWGSYYDEQPQVMAVCRKA